MDAEKLESIIPLDAAYTFTTLASKRNKQGSCNSSEKVW